MGLWERLRSIRKGPLAVAGLLGAPLFFCSLMATSLAIARPRIVTWTHHGKRISRFHAPAASVEARIWLWALVPLALLLGVGLLASLWRFGGFVSCAAGIVLALAVTHRVNEWARHHTAALAPRDRQHPRQVVERPGAPRRVGEERGPDGLQPLALDDRARARDRAGVPAADLAPDARSGARRADRGCAAAAEPAATA